MTTHKRWAVYQRRDKLFGIMTPEREPATNGQVIPGSFSEVSEGKDLVYWNRRLDIVIRHVEKLNRQGEQPA